MHSSTTGVFFFHNCVDARQYCKWFALHTALVNILNILFLVINVFILHEQPALSTLREWTKQLLCSRKKWKVCATLCNM